MNQIKKAWPLLVLLLIAGIVIYFKNQTPVAAPAPQTSISIELEKPAEVVKTEVPVDPKISHLEIKGLKREWSMGEPNMRLQFASDVKLDQVELVLKNDVKEEVLKGKKVITLNNLHPGTYEVMAVGYADETKVAQSQMISIKVIEALKVPRIPKSRQKIYL